MLDPKVYLNLGYWVSSIPIRSSRVVALPMFPTNPTVLEVLETCRDPEGNGDYFSADVLAHLQFVNCFFDEEGGISDSSDISVLTTQRPTLFQDLTIDDWSQLVCIGTLREIYDLENALAYQTTLMAADMSDFATSSLRGQLHLDSDSPIFTLYLVSKVRTLCI